MRNKVERSERILKKLMSEEVTILFTQQGNDLSILIKAPINTCKSLIIGCSAEIIIGKDDTLETPIIHSGIRIFDDINKPLLLTGAHRCREENNALIKILKSESCLVGLFSELGILVATGQVELNSIAKQKAIELIGKEENLYHGNFTEIVTNSLDSFDYSIDNSRQFQNPYLIDILTIVCTFKDWNTIDSNYVGLMEHPQTKIDDIEEGTHLEKQVWFSIESLFPYSIYLNPKYKTTKGEKELTDILAFHDLGIFLIETKGLSVFAPNVDKSMEKKVTTQHKHIRKAIKQLVGAKENIEKGTEFYSSSGEKIEFKRDIVPHCIVLVSELLPFGDWENIQEEILIAMRDAKIYLNVLDFREFMTLVKISKGKKEYLDFYLMQRTEKFVMHKNIHIRTGITGSKDI